MNVQFQDLARRTHARRARAELARRSLAEMFRQAVSAGVIAGLREIEWAPHLDALCSEIQNMLEGWLIANGLGTPRMRQRVIAHWERHGLEFQEGLLLVQNWIAGVPPGTLKSTILMVVAPAWLWLHAPRFTGGFTSSNDRNVERDSMAMRDLVTSEWYRTTFEIDWTIRRDSDSIGKWITTAGGQRLSRTIGAGFVGLHLDGIFVDDVDDADKVWNEPERLRVQSRWTRALENRVNHEQKSIRMGIQQGVHHEDWTLYLLAASTWSATNLKGWAWCCIPMEYGKAPKYAPAETPFGWRDWRTEDGECMQPERFPPDVLEDKRLKLGNHGFESQYNQNPTPIDGGLIARAFLRFFVVDGDESIPRPRPLGCTDAAPHVLGRHEGGRLALDWLTLTVDCSNGGETETASAVGLLVVGGKGQLRFVFDDRTAVMGISEMYASIKACIAFWRVSRVLVELKAAGASVIADLRQALAKGDIIGTDGLPVSVVVEAVRDVRDSKVSRARAMVSAYEAGHVFLLDGAPWLYPTKGDEGHIGELCTFPNSKRDDRVDAMSQLMTHYRKPGSGIFVSHGGYGG